MSRQGFCGRDWTADDLNEGRAECLAYVRSSFDFLENTILEDGRHWVLGTENPSLADIEGSYYFHLACPSCTLFIFPTSVVVPWLEADDRRLIEFWVIGVTFHFTHVSAAISIEHL